MPLFEALSQLLALALEEIPEDEHEQCQHFTLEHIQDWGIAIYINQHIIELVEFCDDVIVPIGGVHFTGGYDFYDCQCQRCQRLNAIHEKRLVAMRAS